MIAMALVFLTVMYPVSVLAAVLLGVRLASPAPFDSTTQEDPEMSKVTDAFAQYVAYRDQKEADAVTAAVAAEAANHQAEVDAAVDANEDAEAGAILLAIPTAEPAPEPAPEG